MRRHSTATLMNLTKKELVEYVRMAEYNQDVAEATLKQQAENVKDWFPVVRGRWEEADDGDGVVCSVCREDFCTIYLETERFNYCPNCGARMKDGE